VSYQKNRVKKRNNNFTPNKVLEAKKIGCEKEIRISHKLIFLNQKIRVWKTKQILTPNNVIPKKKSVKGKRNHTIESKNSKFEP